MSLSEATCVQLLTGLVMVASGFNFDTHQPIVIHNLFDKNSSHFGASVVLVDAKTGPGWVVVGSPKADNPYADYSRIKEPGLVWKCSLGLDDANECSIVNVDPIGEMDVKVGKVPRKLIHKDRKDFSMLGSAMYIGASDRFVACSSRWVNQKYTDLHLMNGLCYWMTKDELLNNNSTAPDFSHRLVPLLNSTRQAYNVTKPNGVAEHRFDWAFGQAGFSIHLTKKNELLIGAPGVLEWAGTVVEYRDAKNVSRAYRRFNVKPKDSVFAHVLVARAQTQINNKVYSYFDYFGYAVTSGKFLRRNGNNTQYAVGAPRGSTLSGKVLIFTFQEEGGTSEELPESLHFLVDPLEGASASHFASYFGSVLGALDVNGDGWDDLLVGAPLYEDSAPRYSAAAGFSSDSNNNATDTGDEEESDILLNSGDEGCVFVYLSEGDDFGREPQQICGDSRPGARFGSSICPLGDINYDGFADVAIGAPYEADGKGAVYIYIGSSKRLILSQKLSSEGLNLGIRGFGYALSGGVDVDENGYPDLAVGSYLSNHAAIYRSLPVVNVTGNLSTPVGKLKTETGVFPITSCLRFQGTRIPSDLDIWIKLSVDTEVRKTRIVEFKPDSRIADENYSRGTVTFRSSYNEDGTCYTFNISTVGDLDLVTLPVTIRQEFWLDPYEESISPLVYEIRKDAGSTEIPETISKPLNPKFVDLKQRRPIHFPIITKSTSWKTISIPIAAVCEEDGDPNCLADLRLKAFFRTPDGDFYDPGEKFVIGSAKSLILQVEIMNLREKANLPLTVDMTWQTPPTVRNSRSDCRKIGNGEDDIQQEYSCSLTTPLSKGKKETVELELDMSGIYAEAAESNITFHVTVNTSSALVSDPKIEVKLPILRRAQLLLLGQTTEATYYENITAETLNFTHVFEVGLIGQSPITGIQMTIAIPAALIIEGNRVPLLHVREPTTNYEGGKITCTTLNGAFYKDPAHVSYEDLRRRRRDASKKANKSNTRKKSASNTKKPLKLSCLTQGVECLRVHCEALQFRPTYRALVEFRLRLLTDTARLLFSEHEREIVVIESLAKVSMLGSIGLEQTAVSQTLVRAELPSEVKAWILILASGGGLVLLSLIIILLTQCGFFRRHKLEELQALMAERDVNEHFLVDDMEEEFYDYGDGGHYSGSSLDFDYINHQHMPYGEEEIYDELDYDSIDHRV